MTRPLGSGVLRFKGFAGWTQGKTFPGDELYDTKGSSTFGIGVEYARNGWTGRFHTNRTRLNDEVGSLQSGEPLPAALAFAPNGAQILDRLSLEDRLLTLKSLALAYDSGPMQGGVSYSTIASSDWPTRRIFYANMGYVLAR